MEERVWEIVSASQIPYDTPWADVERLQHAHDTLVRALFRVLDQWIDDHGREAQYCEDAQDCYDGLKVSAEDLWEFCKHILAHGKYCYELMMERPFSHQAFLWVYLDDWDRLVDDDKASVHLYTHRDVSCGNSSCLYLDLPPNRPDAPLWDELVKAFVATWLQLPRYDNSFMLSASESIRGSPRIP